MLKALIKSKLARIIMIANLLQKNLIDKVYLMLRSSCFLCKSYNICIGKHHILFIYTRCCKFCFF